MSTRLQARVVRRPSLPLTERDERDLDMIRSSPTYRRALAALAGRDEAPTGTSEAALLHAVFEAGLDAVARAAQEAGYAELAAERQQDMDERRAEARRRRPSWTDEA